MQESLLCAVTSDHLYGLWEERIQYAFSIMKISEGISVRVIRDVTRFAVIVGEDHEMFIECESETLRGETISMRNLAEFGVLLISTDSKTVSRMEELLKTGPCQEEALQASLDWFDRCEENGVVE